MRQGFDGRRLWLNLIAGLMVISGLLTLGGTLFEIRHLRNARLVVADARFTVIAGISLIYLAALIRRGKCNAWYISLLVFSALWLRNLRHFIHDTGLDENYLLRAFPSVLLPALIISGLIRFRDLFVIKSEPTSFRIAVRRSAVVLGVAFLYGIAGFLIFDTRDFHQEISLPAAGHYTIDQFGLTTNHQVVAHTKRSVVFVDSLTAISLLSVAYTLLSLAAPVRYRLKHAAADYVNAAKLVARHGNTSEDFFKLWPRDKSYFFSQSRSTFIAYKVVKRVALIVADPVGSKTQAKTLLTDFERFCTLNDWQPAIIHAEAKNLKIYKALGYDFQKIGQEAIVDIHEFNSRTVKNKYFRHIRNKFTKQGYECVWISPPHDQSTIRLIRRISDDWLAVGGRAERGFMMGYFTPAYIQQCRLLVVKDYNGVVEGFINQLPITVNKEADFDFLRHGSGAPTNINDFMMLEFIRLLGEEGYQTLNMGLAPLTGLGGDAREPASLINNLLNFAYVAGGRFYSFQGLARFKTKYEPQWQDRYIVYKGGIVGFSRTMNSLIRAMRR